MIQIGFDKQRESNLEQASEIPFKCIKETSMIQNGIIEREKLERSQAHCISVTQRRRDDVKKMKCEKIRNCQATKQRLGYFDIRTPRDILRLSQFADSDLKR